ncbi:MAG: chemotaxis-specific protein-glutamate methyltransferase CheB [Alphaproteobacteria bacterium]|nr:chemotaxis-specific protein-glutamate methyltransferase CheB [Alphaproteobacteria bacterium]
MVVEDSIVIRGLISRALESDPDIKVVASAADGEIGIRMLKKMPVDVIVLDIEMPVMDGMTAIPHLLGVDPAVKIIMASTLTLKNAEISMKALELGASDYVPKPVTSRELTAAVDFKRELVDKVKVLAVAARRAGVRRAEPEAPAFRASQPGAQPAADQDTRSAFKDKPAPPAKVVTLRTHPIIKPDIIAIGSSTGGPQALFKVIKDLGADLQQPIVLTQHMPPSFTTILADHINKHCGVPCSEAKDGDVLTKGKVLLAPGNYHMTIVKNPAGQHVVKLNQEPAENFCRPAVDPMLRSLLPLFDKRILVVILTGMGQDGMKSSDLIVQAGGSVIAQDEATSVVWGMPGAVAMAGLCSAVLPLNDVGGYARKIALGMKP